MQRRNLIRLALAGMATGALMPKAVLAKAESANSLDKYAHPMVGGVFYTKDAPGRWQGKENGHTPIIEVEKKSGKISVKITTGHEMKGFAHYIIKHILLGEDYRFLGEKMFDPAMDKAPISTFPLGEYSGRIYALSVCNKHDTWLAAGEV
uniref:Superoxide reductase n=1 Tax=Candidatus Kentrum sp. LPFa TaxID=2126335 RepID=A0A450XYH4_9GAMM|nr:MAG: superoxide reductase [Candidatus Kentron sp. LPFa]VFK34342.1 MAG: superoxide reductase [Candidatus Kentron sp. LPFa]